MNFERAQHQPAGAKPDPIGADRIGSDRIGSDEIQLRAAIHCCYAFAFARLRADSRQFT